MIRPACLDSLPIDQVALHCPAQNEQFADVLLAAVWLSLQSCHTTPACSAHSFRIHASLCQSLASLPQSLLIQALLGRSWTGSITALPSDNRPRHSTDPPWGCGAAKFFWWWLFQFCTLSFYTFYGIACVALTPSLQIAAVISTSACENLSGAAMHFACDTCRTMLLA